jgi:hypothetical protein
MILSSELNKREWPSSGSGYLFPHITHRIGGCVAYWKLSAYVAYKSVPAPPRNSSSHFAACS